MQNNPNSHLPNKLIMKNLIGLVKGLLILVASLSFIALNGQTNSLVLDGKGAYLDIPESVSTTSEGFTFETWFYYTGAQRWARIMDFGNDTKTHMFLTSSAGTANVARFLISKAGKSETADSKVALQPGNWYHIAFVFEGKAFTMYLNGESVAEKTFTYSPASLGVLQNRWIGKSHYDWDDYLNSKLAETRIWNVARTADEIKESMSCALDGSEEGLSALYQFKVAADSIAVDTKGENYGTLRGDNGVPALVEVAEIAGNLKACKEEEVTEVEENVANALSFDGSGDYVELGNPAFYVNSFAIETWIKPDGKGTGTVLNIKDEARNSSVFLMFNGNGQMRFTIRNPAGSSGGVEVVSTTAFTDNKWHHVAAVKGDDDKTYLYVDGKLEKTSTKTIADFGGSKPYVVYLGMNVPGAARYYKGIMDEVRIWDRSRSQEEIAADYDKALTGTEAGLHAYYKFDQGTPGGNNAGQTSLVDATGKANGTLQGFALTGGASNFVSSGLSLKTNALVGGGNALLLNGINSFVDCGDFLTTSYTKEVWIKLDVDNLKTNNNIISGNTGHAFRILNGKADAGQSGSWTQVQDPNPIEAGWQHYAVTYDDSTQMMTLYRNGEAVSEKVGVAPQSAASVQLGQYASCCQFRGMMDEVRIWDHARDGADIANDYNKALTGSESGLLAYYNFNQGIANGNNTGITTLNDLTGNNDGTLKNFALTANSTSNFVQSDLGIGDEEAVAANNALHLDGTKDYIDARATATGLPQGREPRTMEAWVKTTQTSIGNFVSWGRRANHMRNSMAVRSGKLAYIGQYLDFTGKTPINDGEWHHVALSYDGENWAIYVDGKADGTSGGDPNTTDQNLKIGNLPEPHNGEYFDGTMDELRIWKVARTADEIVATMNTELTGKEEGLVAYYNFNQGVAGGDNSTVTTLMDQAGNNNGTLMDFALTGDASNWVASNPAIQSIGSESIPVVKVLGAIWGVGNDNANCTTEVQALANNPTTPFGVNGSNLGTDPKYGHTKELRVAYEINDVVYFRKQKDHSTFDFLGASMNPKITIQQAIWGVSGYESDVKAVIQDLVDHGAVGFISQGTVLGKDPKYGTKKTLKLVYEVGGETYEKEVKDHDFIYLTTAFEDAVKGVETNAQDD